MADVRMPDGTIIRGVPEGTTKQELQRRYDKMRAPTAVSEQQEPRGPVSQPTHWLEAMGRSMNNRFLDNLLGGVEFSAEVMAGASTRNIARYMTERTRGNRPRLLPDLDLPGSNEVNAAIATGGDLLDSSGGMRLRENYRANLQEEQARTDELRERHSIASDAGDILGDVMTLGLGRAPFAKWRGRTPPKRFQFNPLPTEAGRVTTNVLNSRAVRSLARGAGKSLETGLEGLTLSIVQDGDPLETAAYAAGGQAAGNLLLTTSKAATLGQKGVFGKALGTATTAAVLTGFVRLAQEKIPGVEGNIYDAMDVSFKTISLAVLAGMAGTMVGAKRWTSDTAPFIADSIATMPRGAVLSMLKDWQASDQKQQETVEKVLETLAQDPEYFGPLGGTLTRSMRNGTIVQEVEKMMRRKDFREKFEALGG